MQLSQQEIENARIEIKEALGNPSGVSVQFDENQKRYIIQGSRSDIKKFDGKKISKHSLYFKDLCFKANVATDEEKRFDKEVVFEECSFQEPFCFENTIFCEKVKFTFSYYQSHITRLFNKTIFKKEVIFAIEYKNSFNCVFLNTIFEDGVDLAKLSTSIFFHNVIFKKSFTTNCSLVSCVKSKFEKEVKFKLKNHAKTRFFHNLFEQKLILGYTSDSSIVSKNYIHFKKDIINEINFMQNQIPDVSFDTVCFKDKMDYENKTIEANISFSNSYFEKEVNYKNCHFGQNIKFENCVFADRVYFNRSIFQDAYFNGSIFKETADFSGVKFLSDAYFHRAIFEKDLQIYGAYFTEVANFSFIDFQDIPNFSVCIFEDSKKVSFIGANIPYFIAKN